MRPVDSRRVDHAPELRVLFFPPTSAAGALERPLAVLGIAWIGDDVVDHLVANNKAIRIGDWVILAMVPSDASGVNPQKLQNPLDEDVLAVVRALARLRARIDHEAEIARRSVQARATEPSA
jgi:hypothetical protein